MQAHVAPTHQKLLERVARRLFPSEEVITNARKTADLVNPITGFYLELDVWFPKLNLSLEFQDIYHYVSTWNSQLSLQQIEEKDNSKREMAAKRGDTLIFIPCWWDGSSESLVSTIQFHRPDLLQDISLSQSLPVSMNSLPDHFKSAEAVPHVGELMLAAFLPSLLSPIYFLSSPSSSDSSNNELPSFWWMGEKHDGIRCCWNSVTSTLYSRFGAAIDFPFPLEQHFGSSFVDGEIWAGRSAFGETQKIVSVQRDDISYDFLRVIAFDSLDKILSSASSYSPSVSSISSSFSVPFESRYTTLLQDLENTNPFVINSPRLKIEREDKLQFLLRQILSDGGEGIILRQSRSPYVHGRSPFLIKLKATRSDREALVVEVKSNDYLLKLPSGQFFAVEKSNILPLSIGDVVTFTCESYSKRSLPVNPKIYRVRTDLEWDDVLRDHALTAQPNFLNKLSSTQIKDVPNNESDKNTRPMGYWNSEQGQNRRRKFFEDIAKERNFDPLIAENWYPFTISSLSHKKGLISLLSFYGFSLVKALVEIFPEAKFQENNFAEIPRHFWGNVKNRRKFFETYANNLGFNPLIAENWYRIRKDDIYTARGAQGVLSYHQRSVKKAIRDLFPEIGIDLLKFSFVPSNHWKDVSNHRKFFEDFARAMDFDPLVSLNWYYVPYDAVIAKAGGRSVLANYGGNMISALFCVFPNIGLKADNFVRIRGKMLPVSATREILLNFAEYKNFDPLVASNWYPIHTNEFQDWEGSLSTLEIYRWNLPKALEHVFPDIKFDLSLFKSSQEEYWKERVNRRKFLESVAAKNNIDPLVASHWYHFKPDLITCEQESELVLKHHSHSFANAIVKLYPELNLKEHQFVHVPRNYWTLPKNKRKFMEYIAEVQNFDPLKAENWYSVPIASISSLQGGKLFLRLYNFNLAKAVCSLFPEINAVESGFMLRKKDFYWHQQQNRRTFLDEILSSKGYNPKNTEDWYNLKTTDITQKKGGKAILAQYEGSMVKTLINTYPDLHFDIHKFPTMPKNHWADLNRRKELFLSFAKFFKFDPLKKESWYSVLPDQIANFSKLFSVLRYYNGSFSKAVVSLFPELDLVENSFASRLYKKKSLQ